jgi:hypothetical protein
MSGTTSVAISERRRWQRLALAIPVFVRGTDESGRPFLEFATALNISAGGALLVLRRSLSPHAEVGVEIPAAPISQKLTARRSLDGEIVRVQDSFGWSSCATRFIQPVQQEGESHLKE